MVVGIAAADVDPHAATGHADVGPLLSIRFEGCPALPAVKGTSSVPSLKVIPI